MPSWKTARLLAAAVLAMAALPLMAEELTYVRFDVHESSSVSVRFEGSRKEKAEGPGCLTQEGERLVFALEHAIPACSIDSFKSKEKNKLSGCEKSNGDLFVLDRENRVPICLLKKRQQEKKDVPVI